MLARFYCYIEVMSLHDNKHLRKCLARQKTLTKKHFLHLFFFKWKKPRINNGVINNVFKDALFFQHLNMAGRHLLLYLFCFSFETSYFSFLESFFFIRTPFIFRDYFQQEESSVVYQKYLWELLGYSSRRDCTVKVSSEMRTGRFILVNLKSCPECDRVFCVISKYFELCKVFYKVNYKMKDWFIYSYKKYTFFCTWMKT